MSTKKSPTRGTRQDSSRPAGPGKSEATPSTHGLGDWLPMTPEAFREVVESVVIAFVLAFLFRTFEAEAFVIPTGSMAPTLMGRHRDVVCDQCGFQYQVSASDEVDRNGNVLSGKQIVSGTCPNCRHTMYLGTNSSYHDSYPSYKGDRILVGKFPYQFSDPQRWDVAVFRFPGEAKTNYIKRLVGLPGETLRIQRGNVYVKHAADADFTIARKPPDKILATLQPVFDNDHLFTPMEKGLWGPRWIAMPTASGDKPQAPGPWTASPDGRSFSAPGTADEAWLGYRHLVPSYYEWRDYIQGRPGTGPTTPQLITDFTSYNTEMNDEMWPPYDGRPQQENEAFDGTVDGKLIVTGRRPSPGKLGMHWVGDLAVECQLVVEKPGGEAVIRLIQSGRAHDCRIDLTSGKATLTVEGLPKFAPTADTPIRGPGSYWVRLANVDDQLVLWVNEYVVPFTAAPGTPVIGGNPTAFDARPLGNGLPQPADLLPARIGSRKASLQVRHLNLRRDIYYIAARSDLTDTSFDPMSDLPVSRWPFATTGYGGLADTHQVFSEPRFWPAFAASRVVQFELGPDQYFMLGDNSAESKDSRLWGTPTVEYYVSRELLIGKALWVYWPHSLDHIPYTKIPFRLRFGDFEIGIPDVSQMGPVR